MCSIIPYSWSAQGLRSPELVPQKLEVGFLVTRDGFKAPPDWVRHSPHRSYTSLSTSRIDHSIKTVLQSLISLIQSSFHWVSDSWLPVHDRFVHRQEVHQVVIRSSQGKESCMENINYINDIRCDKYQWNFV